MSKFIDFPIVPSILSSIQALGFETPTEIQEKIIPLLLKNLSQDVHAQAQTGTGKTLAFGIPLLHTIDSSSKIVQALVVAPTRELVLQIFESLRDVSRQTGIKIEPIYGGMPMQKQIDGIKRGAQIVIGTPGRLIDHIKRRTLKLDHVKTLVLDEADIMLDMGFREDIDQLLEQLPTKRSIWLFSATVKSGIKQLIDSHMRNVLSVRATTQNVTSKQVQQYYSVVQKSKRIEAAIRFIEAAPEFYGIIFCQTKLLTGEVSERLASRGFRANCLHGDMSQSLRNQVIKGFKQKDFPILVATDVAARGIDVTNLSHVINFSIPEEHENYIHRIGRTGRAGKEGIAILLIASNETSRLRRLEKSIHVKLQEIPVPSLETIISAKMSAVSDFIEQSKHPRKELTEVHSAIMKLIESFSLDEIRASFAVALEDKFFADMVHEDIQDVPMKEATSPREICLQIGHDNGMTEDRVRNYLHTTCGLLPQEITKVRVLNKKSFISMPEDKLSSCLQAMQKNPIKRGVAAEIVEDFYRPRREGSRSHEGRRDNRDSRNQRGRMRFRKPSNSGRSNKHRK